MTSTVTRKVIRIDEAKCNGCGECITACREGALQLVDGKATLVKDDFCDGLGACIGECPRGALTFEEREAAPFDEAAVEQHLAAIGRAAVGQVTRPDAVERPAGGGCPSAQARALTPASKQGAACGCPSAHARTLAATPGPTGLPGLQDGAEGGSGVRSALANWPTQLMLVPLQAAYLQGADLLISADCVPFAYAGFHQDLLPGKVVLQACPKLDDVDFYREKLTAMFAHNDLQSVTVARMEVPCCGGLVAAVRHALDASGKDIPLEVVTVGVEGEVLDRQSYGS